MFNWRDFDRMFDEMFNNSFGDNRGWDKKSYRSPDGSISYTFMTRGGGIPKNDELEFLKHKLNKSVEEQDFEQAVELRDKIKNLEENKEKISELQSKLDECVKNQEFEKAIEYRDKIKALK
jgi:protein-arginine kinase activator protein McsA